MAVKNPIFKILNYYSSLSTTRGDNEYIDKRHSAILKSIDALELTKEDFNSLTYEDMSQLGFGKWSNESELMLIPHYLHGALPKGLVVTCINGTTYTVGVDTINDDIRYGKLAYGLFPKPKSLKVTQEEINELLGKVTFVTETQVTPITYVLTTAWLGSFHLASSISKPIVGAEFSEEIGQQRSVAEATNLAKAKLYELETYRKFIETQFNQ